MVSAGSLAAAIPEGLHDSSIRKNRHKPGQAVDSEDGKEQATECVLYCCMRGQLAFESALVWNGNPNKAHIQLSVIIGEFMKRENFPCRLALIRHGATEWNRDGRWQGQTDVPLSAAGRAQAARLARRLQAEGARFDALYASDQKRARETAAILGGALGLTPAAAPALREIDLGHWAGHTKEEIARLYPEEWGRLEAGGDIPRGGGETFAGFQARILAWLLPTAARHAGQSVAVVTHGGVIRAVLLHARGLEWSQRRLIPSIANASVSVVETTARGWRILSVGGETGPAEGARTWPAGTPAGEDEVV
jgi:broad specificity phosphatase PhoE